ncbi:MAG: DUF4249 family protein [Chlorobi bacterium]|nr:DUF4249 family protein [Chlorobiota bacterium]
MYKQKNILLTPAVFKLIVAIVLLYFISSCRDLVQDEFPDFIPVPTVNSILIAGDTLRVHVSLSGKIEKEQLNWVNNAEVKLYVNDQFKENLDYFNEGIYTSQTIVEPANTYKCKVLIPGYDTVVCVNSIPVPSQILNIVHINNAGKDEEGLTYPAVQLTFNNNVQQERYYEVIIRLFQYDYEYPGQIYTITDPVLQNEGLPIVIFSNELINDTTYTMLINYTTGSAASSGNDGWHSVLYPLIIELRSINYDYYQYVKQYYLYETGRFPNIVGGVVTSFPLYSNIDNAYGIFTGYSKVMSDTIYPESQFYK